MAKIDKLNVKFEENDKKTFTLKITSNSETVSESEVSQKSSIDFYNNTDKDIFISFAFYDKTNSCLTSKGWYNIEAYKQKEIPLGFYSGDVYIYGESTNPGTFWVAATKNIWGSGYSFCIDPNESFEIRNADKIKCENRKSFSKLKIDPGKNKYTFNP